MYIFSAAFSSAKVFKIWHISILKLGFISKKPRWGKFPLNIQSPLSPKLLAGCENVWGCKNGMDMLYLLAKLGGEKHCC